MKYGINKSNMPDIGTMTTGAGVNTTVNQEYLPQFLQVGNVDDANVVQALRVSTKGVITMDLSNAARIQTFATLDMSPLIAAGASEIPLQLQLSNGQIDQRTQITLQNVGATTPTIFGNSFGMSPNNMARYIVESSIDVTQNQSYSDFEYLAFLPANVSRVDVTYMNGFNESLGLAELQGIFARFFNTEANVLINGHLIIAGTQNPFAPIKSVKIYNGAGGATTVAQSFYSKV